MIWQNNPANEPAADEISGAARKTVRKMLAIIPILAAAVLCYAVTVFAWFQDSLVNSGNIIQAGRFSAAVEITQDGKSIWSSAESLNEPAGILGCDEQISGISPGEAVLRITNNSDSTLSLQYAMLLTEGDDISGPEVKLTFGALWEAQGNKTNSQDNGQVLQPGWSATYTFTVNEGVSALYLQFRTAFVANSAPTFATTDNAATPSIQRAPTTAETTAGSRPADASASPTTAGTNPQSAFTSKAKTTGQTEAAPTSGEAVSATTGSAAAGSGSATETGGNEPAATSEAAGQATEETTAPTNGSATGETTTTAAANA